MKGGKKRTVTSLTNPSQAPSKKRKGKGTEDNGPSQKSAESEDSSSRSGAAAAVAAAAQQNASSKATASATASMDGPVSMTEHVVSAAEDIADEDLLVVVKQKLTSFTPNVFKDKVRFYFQVGFPLSLSSRINPLDAGEGGSKAEKQATPSQSSGNSHQPKRRGRPPGAFKGSDIYQTFGIGGIFLDKLIRCLSSAMIADCRSFMEYQDFPGYALEDTFDDCL